MTRYLTYTSPARGHLYPIVPTLLALRDRGHDVHVRTLASEVPALRDVGLNAAPLPAEIEALPLDDWKVDTPAEALDQCLRVLGERADLEIPDLREAIDQTSPDVLLLDMAATGACTLAEALDLPWVDWVPFFQHVSPFGLSSSWIDGLNERRRALGLTPVDGPHDLWRAPRTLYFTGAPFEPTADLPSSFRLVGPGSWEPPAPLPPWIDELSDPVVLVTTSSERQLDQILVETALQALEGEPYTVVATTVAHDPGQFTVPPNARVVSWFPHGALLDRAACVVCHGGMGITQKALAAGVPVCVVPFGRDQFEVAEQVTRVGVGKSLPATDLSATALREAVRDAVARRPASRELAAHFAAYGGAGAAADVVESLGAAPVREGA